MGWPLLFSNPAFWAAASTALGIGANKVNSDARAKENSRLALSQQQRANDEALAKSRGQQAEFAAQMRSDSIADQQYQLENRERGDFAKRIQDFDLIEKSKSMGKKQDERIAGQAKAIAQATADNKLRAGSDVEGRISDAFEGAVEAKSGEVQDRAANIGALMGRLSGAKADSIRENDIIRDLNSKRNVAAMKAAAIREDAKREIRKGKAEGNVASWIAAPEVFNYDASNSLGKWLGIGSQAAGLAGLTTGFMGSGNLAGKGMSEGASQLGSKAESMAAFNAGDVTGYGLPMGSTPAAQTAALNKIRYNPLNLMPNSFNKYPKSTMFGAPQLAPMGY